MISIFKNDILFPKHRYLLERLVRRASRTSYSNMVNDILIGLYSVEYLAAHSLCGGGPKPGLQAVVVGKIIGTYM